MNKSLNQRIDEYTNQLQEGEIHIAYKGIILLIGKMRADFIKKYPDYDISAMYQGYMDMTFFSLSTKELKGKGLKIAIVYLHKKKTFEVWLSARNRDIASNYEAILSAKLPIGNNIFHDIYNQDAIIESIITSTPNFDGQDELISVVQQGVENFLKIVTISLAI